jgi:uncharacterized protein (DUF697 family)
MKRCSHPQNPPDEMKKIDMPNDDKTARLKKANETVRSYTLTSMSTGLIPVPIVDQVVLTGVQQKMLHSLTNLYEIPFSKSIVKPLLGAMLKGVATRAMMSSFLKFIPGGGTVAGTMSAFMFNGASTYAVGRVFTQHFESGGTLLTFDPKTVSKLFKTEFEKGKNKVKEFKEQQ